MVTTEIKYCNRTHLLTLTISEVEGIIGEC